MDLYTVRERLHAHHGEVPVEIRLLKLTEEVGEAAEALIGMQGLNRRPWSASGEGPQVGFVSGAERGGVAVVVGDQAGAGGAVEVGVPGPGQVAGVL